MANQTSSMPVSIVVAGGAREYMGRERVVNAGVCRSVGARCVLLCGRSGNWDSERRVAECGGASGHPPHSLSQAVPPVVRRNLNGCNALLGSAFARFCFCWAFRITY